MKLVSGDLIDIMKISRPAAISHHQTYLQVICNDFCVLTNYLKVASQQKDPMQRLIYVISGFVTHSTQPKYSHSYPYT
jgi:hypothetical protein